MRIFLTTRFVAGSTRPRTFSDRSATQRLPAPYAIPNGRVANGMRRTTAFVAGAIRTMRPRTGSVVQTEPAAETTRPDCWPTGTLASGATGAAAAQTAATAAMHTAHTRARLRLVTTTTTTSSTEAWHVFITGPYR